MDEYDSEVTRFFATLTFQEDADFNPDGEEESESESGDEDEDEDIAMSEEKEGEEGMCVEHGQGDGDDDRTFHLTLLTPSPTSGRSRRPSRSRNCTRKGSHPNGYVRHNQATPSLHA